MSPDCLTVGPRKLACYPKELKKEVINVWDSGKFELQRAHILKVVTTKKGAYSSEKVE